MKIEILGPQIKSEMGLWR